MSYRAILELTDRINAESSPEQKIALLEELRKMLNEEKEMLHANLANFFPCAWASGQLLASASHEETPLAPNANSLRQDAEALRMKASNYMQEADALAIKAASLEEVTPVNGGAKPDKPSTQAAKAA